LINLSLWPNRFRVTVGIIIRFLNFFIFENLYFTYHGSAAAYNSIAVNLTKLITKNICNLCAKRQ